MSQNIPSVTPKTPQRWAWMWLAYSGFLFIDPLLDPSPIRWTATVTAFALLLIIFTLYVRSCEHEATKRWTLIGLTFVLALATYCWNPGGSAVFVYAASFVAFQTKSEWKAVGLFAVEIASLLVEYFLLRNHRGFFEVNWPNTAIAIFLILIVGGGNILMAQQKRADYKLRMAGEEIEALAAVAERERIARDLHDVLGHTLSLIVLKSELAKRLVAADPERAATEIADVERAARTALTEVREAIGGYRTRGLAAEIDAARRALDVAGVELASEVVTGELASLTAGEETVLALALREAVTNIVRHARAQNCRLRFVTQDGRRRLLVEDDGTHALAVREGNGLRGMRERVESLGGILRVERDHGTRVLIELPVSTGVA